MMLNDRQRRMIEGVRGFEEVGHGLARICRFGGRIEGSYSVLAHSIVVARLVPPATRIHGLLHDAAEIFTGDQPRPFKTDAAKALEGCVLDAIYARLGVPLPSVGERDAVRAADMDALAAEWWLLAPLHPEDWETPAEPSPRALRMTLACAAGPLSGWLSSDCASAYADECRLALRGREQ